MKKLSVGVLSVLFTLLLTSCQGKAEPPSDEQADQQPTIAVLPFENLSSDPDDAYLADGIHEELLSNLAKDSRLRVVSRTSVMKYADTRTSVSQIASDLRVGYVLEGAVRISEDRLRITVQLIDAEEGYHIWAESFDREVSVGKLFAVQQEIAARVAESVAASLGESSPDGER